MSRVSGVGLILAGLAAGGYVLMQDEGVEPHPTVAQTEITKSPITVVEVAPAEPRPAFRPAPVARKSERSAAPVVITVPARSSDVALGPRVAIPRDREALVRELQKELRRVGCYEGEVNGVWTPATRRAMKSFIDRANAALPVDEPDPILYSIVQGQTEHACGRGCPAGQGLSDDGRCLPAAILAKANRKALPAPTSVAAATPPAPAESRPVITGWSTTSTPATPPPAAIAAVPAQHTGAPPIEGRMGLAGPAAEGTPQPNPALGVPGPLTPTAVPQAARPTPPKPSSGSGGWARQMLTRRDSQN